MKIIINCDPEHIEAATDIAISEAKTFAKYTKIGWGWAYGRDPRFFVRRITDGLSIRQTKIIPHPNEEAVKP